MNDKKNDDCTSLVPRPYLKAIHAGVGFGSGTETAHTVDPRLSGYNGTGPSLASQTHFRKRGKGLVNSVYKPCPGALYCTVRPNHVAVFCHMMHYIIVSVAIAVLKTVKGHLSRYYRNYKNTLRIVFRERAYPATGNSRVHYLKSGYIIQLITF